MEIAKHPSRVSLPRIDKPYPTILEFLTQRFPSVGQDVWEERILTGKVLDDAGVPITLETPYIPQKRLFYYREVLEEPMIPLPEKILFQNDELLVACKPPFLPVTPSGPYVNECLLNRLRRKTGNSSLVPLHRIDRETSGLVLFSTNEKTRGLYGDGIGRFDACRHDFRFFESRLLQRFDRTGLTSAQRNRRMLGGH